MLLLALLALGLLASICIGGLLRLHGNVRVASDAFAELRNVYEIGSTIDAATSNGLSFLQRQEKLHLARIRLDELHTETLSDVIAWRQLRARLDNPPRQIADLESWKNSAYEHLAKIVTSCKSNVAASENASQQIRSQVLMILVAASFICVLILMSAALVTYRSVVRPLRSLINAADKFGMGDLSARAPASDDRETQQLATAFNQMAARLELLCTDMELQVRRSSQQLVSASRLANMGLLASGVVHEINNPLAIIDGYAQRALRQINKIGFSGGGETLIQDLNTVRSEVARLQSLTRRLLGLARPEITAPGPVSVDAICRQVVDSISVLPNAKRVAIRFRSTTTRAIHTPADPIRQIALNLILNAINALQECPLPQIDIELADNADGVRLSIADNGCGMSPETIERIYTPFFTLGSSDELGGAGLGLSIVHAAVDALNGTITATSDGVGKGSCFIVCLPSEVEANL